jgi:MFS family permease
MVFFDVMHPRVILSVGNFFFSIFSTLVTFILLPYLSTFMPSAYTGFVLAGSAIGAIVVFPFLPKLVQRYGAQQIALTLALLEMVVLFALAEASGIIASVLLIAVTIAVQPFLAYQFDLLIEATFTDSNATGRVYSLFRTAWNTAALAAPLLLGALLANSDSYGRIFLACAAMLAPLVILFTIRKLPASPAPQLTRMGDTLRTIFHNRDLSAVMVGNLLLYLFLVWMPLYTPVYLHNVLGVSWTNLGWIFAIMLIPYVVVEYPAGWIADRYLGDKEMMFVGFIIAGAGLAALAWLTPTSSLLTILLILTGSRVGAALVESMVNAHFFRRISKRDVNSVSVYRSVWPLSYLIAPLVGSVLLVYGSYSTFFISTGAFIIVAGVTATLLIKDFQ